MGTAPNIDYTLMNTRFGLGGQIVFKEGAGGMPLVMVTNSQAHAQISLQGGQLLRWTPGGQRPVIWLSPQAPANGKPWRGGVPVCWPWFGPHATETHGPTHGFARTSPWEITATARLPQGATRLWLRLITQTDTQSWWPHATPLTLQITVGTKLEMTLTTQNNTDIPLTLSDALHTYFAVSDVRQIKIHGLAHGTYLDKTAGGTRHSQQGPVTITAETDRVYVDTLTDCLIDDPLWRRRIRVAKRGSRTTVVWNPWEEKAAKMGDLGPQGYLNMVCVESANALENTLTLAPGEQHSLWVSYSCEEFKPRT